MALAQLRINKKIEERRSKLNDLKTREEELQVKENELEKLIEEATQEDEELIDEEITKYEKEKESVIKEKGDLEEEIERLLKELDEIQKNSPTEHRSKNLNVETREGVNTRMKINNYETRSQMLQRLNETDVRDFYSNIVTATRNKGSLVGVELTIPTVVIDMIQTRIGDFSSLYKEVDVLRLTGDARIIMDGAIPEAIWTECCDPVQELSGAFSETEIDCYKVGGFIPICNALLEDSMINLANYIENRLALAIAKAIDNAILLGDPNKKQPTGIIPSVPKNNKVKTNGELINIMSNMALIDNGEDGVPIGEVIAVMARSTYYTHIAPQTFLPTSDGRLVIQTTDSPRLPDGTRIVFSQYVPKDKIIMGDFKKYLLGERAGIKIESSRDVRFIEDQTIFKGTARYDGKPIHPNYFVVIEIDTPTK